jgi:hypothetical protein
MSMVVNYLDGVDFGLQVHLRLPIFRGYLLPPRAPDDA